MNVPTICSKTVLYVIVSLGVAAPARLALAEEASSERSEALRTEVKASLAPAPTRADAAAETVGAALAAEIIASGLKTEILRHHLDSASKPSKVAALKPTDGTASGQADQT